MAQTKVAARLNQAKGKRLKAALDYAWMLPLLAALMTAVLVLEQVDRLMRLPGTRGGR
jgi:hypothetical protein